MAKRTNGMSKSSEVIVRLVEIGTDALTTQLDQDVPRETAAIAMRQIAHDLCVEFAGVEIYFPKDRQFELLARDFAIEAEHASGVLSGQLALKYQISQRQVQIIVKHVRTMRKANGELPPTASRLHLEGPIQGFSLFNAWNPNRSAASVSADADSGGAITSVTAAAPAADRDIAVQAQGVPSDAAPGVNTSPFKKWLERKAGVASDE